MMQMGTHASLSDFKTSVKVIQYITYIHKMTHIKVKSGDLSIMHDHIVMQRHKLSSDLLNNHVTKQRLVAI